MFHIFCVEYAVSGEQCPFVHTSMFFLQTLFLLSFEITCAKRKNKIGVWQSIKKKKKKKKKKSPEIPSSRINWANVLVYVFPSPLPARLTVSMYLNVAAVSRETCQLKKIHS